MVMTWVSPDGNVSNFKTTETIILKEQYPLSKNNISLTEACDDNFFFTGLVHGLLRLKKTSMSRFYSYYLHEGN